jgi:hypothetical protein
MKNFLLSLLFLLSLSLRLAGQEINGKGINFQGIARDAAGNPVKEKPVKIKAALIDFAGNNAYVETHTVTTDVFGLFSVIIGEGTKESGTFEALSWTSEYPYSLMIAIDPTGGSNFTLIGTTTLKSVPYAKYAERAGNAFWQPGDKGNIYYTGGNVGLYSNSDKALFTTDTYATTQAIFGLTYPGISLQQNWPGIGFNHYYKEGQKSVSKGYGGYIGVDPAKGGIYFRTIGNASAGDQAVTLDERMFISPLGLIGIGNTAPTASLDVNRGTGQDGTAIFRGTTHVSHFNYSTTENTYIRGGKSGSHVYINDNNIGNVFLASAGGKVGIGMEAPQGSLDVFKGTNVTAASFRGSSYPSRFAWSTNEDTYIRGGKDGSNVYVNDLNIGNVFLASAGGKVGIGTETPQASLDVVKGKNTSAGSFKGTTYASQFADSDKENTIISGGKSNSAVYINDQNGGNVYLTKLGGGVAIGLSDSALKVSRTKLSIWAHEGYKGFELNAFGNGSTSASIDNYGTESVGLRISASTAGSKGLRVFGDIAIETFGDHELHGDINYYGMLTQASDRRFKKNITTLNSSLEKVMKLRGVMYDYKTEEFPDKNFSKTHQIGFIAQEVKEIVPELTTESRDGFLMVDYSKVTPLLVEALKEQQNQIEELKKENAAVNKKLADLEAKIERLSQLTESEASIK